MVYTYRPDLYQHLGSKTVFIIELILYIYLGTYASVVKNIALASHLFGADLGVKSDGVGASVVLGAAGSAVALGVASLAVELLAAITRVQDVVLGGKGVAVLSVKLVVDVVGVRGVAKEERLVESAGVGNLDGRARSAEILGESLTRLESGQGTGSTAVEGDGLDVDGGVTLVDDDGLVGGRSSAEEGSSSGDGGELHGDNWFWC
jgi:hypothetical protein